MSCFLLLVSFALLSQEEHISYPVIAHAHNDYDKFEPIYNALNYGFTSLEVDIVFKEGKIIVSHDFKKLHKKPEFEKGYLVPFLEAEKPYEPHILLVDLKNYNEEGIELLHQTISRYKDHFVSRHELDKKQGRTQVLLSGGYPRWDIINNERYIYFFIDGRPELVDAGISPNIMPWISTNFKYHLLRRRKGRNVTERIRLAKFIAEVHEAGYQLRFWRTPDRKIIWKTLDSLGVDIIGVDKVRKFYRIMNQIN